ncbi:phage tail tape measure protein [Streptomyces iakyrus]|uniref:phage tail tape measure protein n=1 Tax=Streptomyces iakyrus TaxID=68219 RepID=UPI0036A13E0B
MAEPIRITIAGDAEELSQTLDEAGQEVSRFGEMASGLALAAGGAIAMGIGAGIMEALEQGAGADVLAAQLGATPEEAKQLGEAAGAVYAAGYGESVADANEALKSLWQQGLVPAGATADEMADISKRAMDVATVLGDEVGPTANAVGQMLKTGMAKNAQEAFDILTRGAQTGGNKAEDLLDTFNEYSTQFRKLGLDGKTAMGLISQGLQGGARDSDLVADTLKEFSILAVESGGTASEAFKTLGLNADSMRDKIAKGGPAAQQALGMTLDKLRAIKDPADRANLAVQLFGTTAEDMGDALYSLDVDTAVEKLGKVDGAAKRAGDTMHDNAANKVKEFTRGLQAGVVDFLGVTVIPIVEELATKFRSVGSAISVAAGFVQRHSTTFSIIAGAIATLILPALVKWMVQQAITAAGVVTGWVTTAAASVTSAATQVASAWSTVAGWVAMAGRAVWGGAVVVGQWILMGTQSLLQGARMAAAWVMAMGPIGWIIATIAALAAIIYLNWDKITKYTSKAWNWVWEKVSGALGWIKDAFLKWTGVGIIIKHWDKIVSATGNAFKWVRQKALDGMNAVVGFVQSLPGRLLSYAGKLVNAGKAIGSYIVNGLRSGISRLGGLASSLGSTITNAAKGAVNAVIDLMNFAIPNKLGWGKLSIDLPDSPIPRIRAMGGPASGVVRVGERGPEEVILPNGSRVVPNHSLSSGAGVVVNVQTNADPWQIGREVAWALRTSPA